MNEQMPPELTVDLQPDENGLGAGHAAMPRVVLRDLDSADGSPVVPSPSKEMLEPAARLQLHGEIARGGMGAVLKGRDANLGRDLAVKVLLETHQDNMLMLQRFVEEAQISGQLQHPGIAPVYELGHFADKRPYFTMKLVKGKTLSALLAARKEPAEERSRFVGIFAQVCQTLAYAHARGVIHRDLKPSNVMVGAFGEVQVMDWGLAKVLEEGGVADEERSRARQRVEQVSVICTQRSEGSSASESGSHTQAGTMLGTPAYIAPEQARGEVDLTDERADVFGLGAILCEVLTGRPPYLGKGAEVQYQARTAKLADAFARLDSCGADAELIALARRCLSAELWDRPRDAGKVAEEVTAYQHSVTERLRQMELERAAEQARAVEARATAAQERKARRMTLALAASVLLTVLLSGGGWLWLRLERADRLAQTNRSVIEAVHQATVLRQQAMTTRGRPALALAAQAREQAQRAEALIENESADADAAAQVRQLLSELNADEKDVQFLAALDAVHLAQAQTFATNPAPLLREAFRSYGMPAGEGEATAVAARLGERPAAVREAALAAVQEWIDRVEKSRLKAEQQELGWLRAVLEAAEPDGWWKEVRDAAAEKEPAKRRVALEKLAKSADVERLPAWALTRLADRLWNIKAEESAAALLRRAWMQHAGDFWTNENLGGALVKEQPAEALPYLTAAVALRPDSAGAHHNLANALWAEGKRDEAIAEYRKVTELNPKSDFAHYRLGFDLKEKGDLDGAIAEFSLAWTLNPGGTGARYELFQAFFRQGRLEDFRAAWQNALESNPANHVIWYGYAELCLFLGREEEYRRHRRILLARFGDAADPAVAERVGRACLLLPASGDELQRAAALADRAVAAGPKHEYYGYFLATKGLAEYRLGRFDSALNYLQQAGARGVWMPVTSLVMVMAMHQSGQTKQARGALAAALQSYDWSETPADNQDKWIAHVLRREAEALVVPNLSAFLKEEYHPHDNKERLELIRPCLFGKHYQAAAQLYAEMFAADPKLAEDPKADHLYNAACSAVLAAAGRGEDTKMLDDQQRASLRKQAMDWLRADLALWINRLDGGKPEERQQAREQIEKWQRDPDLASVREKDDMTKLPPDERQVFVKLWAEVTALLEKTKTE